VVCIGIADALTVAEVRRCAIATSTASVEPKLSLVGRAVRNPSTSTTVYHWRCSTILSPWSRMWCPPAGWSLVSNVWASEAKTVVSTQVAPRTNSGQVVHEARATSPLKRIVKTGPAWAEAAVTSGARTAAATTPTIRCEVFMTH
jgi:hypothetical protein